MSSFSILPGVEFLGDQHRPLLRGWYDTLAETEVKGSIQIVKSRELQPHEELSFRLVVLCSHPFRGLAAEIESATKLGDHTKSDRALSTLISSFAQWVESQHVPSKAILADREALIEWWPMEMRQYVIEELPPQARAQIEMSNHILESLDLIRLATISGPDFLSLWIDSDEPHFAAGRLFYGTFKWVDAVPNFGEGEAARADLRESVREFAREYVGLARLALLAGAESPLLERTAFVLRRFKIQFANEIPAWLALGSELLEGIGDTPIYSAIAKPADYEGIDRVCDRFRLSLVNAIEGVEDEIPALVNALLPTLTVP